MLFHNQKKVTVLINKISRSLGIACLALIPSGCFIPSLVQKTENNKVPASYYSSVDTTNTVKIKWREFFNDPNLTSLIDTALRNNQELNILLQDIKISQNEVRARKGTYLPFVDLMGGAGIDKVSRYTAAGASEAITEIAPGTKTPEKVPNYMFGPVASWEVDIWKKLRNAKKSALYRYLATVEGKNFMVTHLVAEIANAYYELMALDNQLDIIKRNIIIQSSALEVVKLQKKKAKVTELAVRRFEALVFETKSLQFGIQQSIIETQNRVNFLVGRYPKPITRSWENFNDMVPNTVYEGIPPQLLTNRPDIRQAELELMAYKLDVKVAKANFYPTLMITAGVGYQAFNTQFLIKSPESMIYSLAGGLVGPMINRNAIKANYFSANAKQIQAVYNYERTVLNAYLEVSNQISNISNLKGSFDLKAKRVNALSQSVIIANTLFRSARANYLEVLLTQRDALESTIELVQTKKDQMNAMVNVYQALGGGWN